MAGGSIVGKVIPDRKPKAAPVQKHKVKAHVAAGDVFSKDYPSKLEAEAARAQWLREGVTILTPGRGNQDGPYEVYYPAHTIIRIDLEPLS